ncbi:SRPBCC domain-containing protein [Brachybacterium sp. ACRRE]|uniref:SRPBCC family protein n=1 Tax=unclassified Brachybacterium TaxID=2623841 RepID=UPI001EF37BF4|nr:SRPBCC domain-containing protein [Brachybacterium sp. ACRRE]MCG7310547.1 SRPBCC domain-containing protein [Brachybacterium sp. ACRRE]
MPVTDITTDLDALTITITAQFDAPVERIWQIYADPRQLERIWGPPAYPATFVDHDLTPGGRMNYYMTSPEGEKLGGFWEILEVDEPRFFRYRDGFADAENGFAVNTDLPVAENTATFEAADGGTRAVYVSIHPTREGLQQVIDMGVEEGSRESIDQIDALVG